MNPTKPQIYQGTLPYVMHQIRCSTSSLCFLSFIQRLSLSIRYPYTYHSILLIARIIQPYMDMVGVASVNPLNVGSVYICGARPSAATALARDMPSSYFPWLLLFQTTHVFLWPMTLFKMALGVLKMRYIAGGSPSNAGPAFIQDMMTPSNDQMETFSALLAIYAGHSPVPGEFPAQRPVTRRFGVFFDLRLNKRLSKQSWGWWFETLSRPLWRRRNDLPITGCLQMSQFPMVLGYNKSRCRLQNDIQIFRSSLSSLKFRICFHRSVDDSRWSTQSKKIIWHFDWSQVKTESTVLSMVVSG